MPLKTGKTPKSVGFSQYGAGIQKKILYILTLKKPSLLKWRPYFHISPTYQECEPLL
jgi:hypothetical protein